MIARGALGKSWLFKALLGGRQGGPTRAEVVDELRWTIGCAVEHLGEARATRYLRKFYPWYLARLELDRTSTRRLQESLQAAPTLWQVGELVDLATEPLGPARSGRFPSAAGAPLYCCAR
jgi:tRNA-dihydrouridine synthase